MMTQRETNRENFILNILAAMSESHSLRVTCSALLLSRVLISVSSEIPPTSQVFLLVCPTRLSPADVTWDSGNDGQRTCCDIFSKES